MSLKVNIHPDIDREMTSLLLVAQVRSKTEYINRAIDAYNQKMKRQALIKPLVGYFREYAAQTRKVMDEFSRVRKSAH